MEEDEIYRSFPRERMALSSESVRDWSIWAGQVEIWHYVSIISCWKIGVSQSCPVWNIIFVPQLPHGHLMANRPFVSNQLFASACRIQICQGIIILLSRDISASPRMPTGSRADTTLRTRYAFAPKPITTVLLSAAQKSWRIGSLPQVTKVNRVGDGVESPHFWWRAERLPQLDAPSRLGHWELCRLYSEITWNSFAHVYWARRSGWGTRTFLHPIDEKW
jgi:hypothetical protein